MRLATAAAVAALAVFSGVGVDGSTNFTETDSRWRNPVACPGADITGLAAVLPRVRCGTYCVGRNGSHTSGWYFEGRRVGNGSTADCLGDGPPVDASLYSTVL